MHSIKTLALALLFISLASATAFAMRHGMPFEHEEKGAMRFEHLKENLDLSAEQEAGIKAVLAKTKESEMARREERHQNQEELRNVLSEENFDETKVRALTQKQAELQAAMLIDKHATMTSIDQILTPEQQEKHAVMRQQRIEHRGKRDCVGAKGGSVEM